MKKIYLFIIVLSFFILACNKSDQKKAGISDETAKEAEKVVSENGGEGCYIPYQTKTCELLDNATIAQIVGIESTQLKAIDVMKELF